MHWALAKHLKVYPRLSVKMPTILAQMKIDSLLLDDIALFGARETSIFTDPKGHQSDIDRETGGLIWLNSIYNSDLNTNTYETGLTTDLHGIAKQITDNHDPNYKQ